MGMRLLSSWRPLAVVASVLAVAVPLACGSDKDSIFPDGADAGNDGSTGPNVIFDPIPDTNDDIDASTNQSDASTGITMTIRDFRFWNSSDNTTNKDFENPPSSGSEWDDRNIVTETLGTDNKPIYGAHPSGTLTTHGATYFAQWFNNVAGSNIAQDIPLATTLLDGGTTEYDSNKSGQPQDPTHPDNGARGFFPIDDGSTYKTAFGNQGKPHNYSFTGEIHAAFTYHGGETFHFRGDDDVWVYIDKKRVIDIGGIHNPETADVSLNTLGLTVGKDYQLDFFFAERHVTGSNVLFQTTLALRAAPPGGIK